MAFDWSTSGDSPRAFGVVALMRGTTGTSQFDGSVSVLVPAPSKGVW